MKIYDKNNQPITLYENSEIKPINITVASGYEIIRNNSFSIGNLYVFNLSVKKLNGNFGSSDETVATLSISPQVSTVLCGLGKNSDWNVNGVGYLYVGGNIKISDRNATNSYNTAYINLVCTRIS